MESTALDLGKCFYESVEEASHHRTISNKVEMGSFVKLLVVIEAFWRVLSVSI